MTDDLKDTIRDNAAGPESAESDGVRIKQHSLADQIAADQYLAQKAAGANPAKALRFAKVVPPGTV
jgi:hypothetical protein